MFESTTPAMIARQAGELSAGISGKTRYVSWEEFQRTYLSRADDYLYEWTDGAIEKTPRTMNTNQLFILDNLNDFLHKLIPEYPPVGRFYAESDILLSAKMHRRPDVAYLTKEQVKVAMKKAVLVPSFVIEIISPTDNVNKVMKKRREYFQKGVKIVWQIYPGLKEVHVYTSEKASAICRGNDKCTAEPVIPGFTPTAKEIFQEPA
jgi:Uma2 family endonuclease